MAEEPRQVEKPRTWVSSSEHRLVVETAAADPALLDDLRDVREAELENDDELKFDA
ncbi:MAG TPA: hypothetical protein VFJ53_09500 [Solirubrobacterales bacterium]|nr:hypothetical protein [Solirubrobacterales bacterium]